MKWVGSRFETIVSDHHGRAARLAGELALDRDGRFLGLRMRWVVNAGAFLSQPGPLINTRNPASHAINVYRIPALYGRHLLALTNTTSTTAYRGAGRPNVSYLVERLVDEAARELGHRPHRDPPPQFHPARGVSRTRRRSARPTTAATRRANSRRRSKSPTGTDSRPEEESR